jgi:hypothetical protein
MSLSKVLGTFTKGILFFAVMAFFFVLAVNFNTDLTAKRSFQRFVNQLEVGQNIGDVQDLATRSLMGVAESPTLAYSRVKGLCQDPNQWIPANLPELLHADEGGTVKEPSIKFAFYAFDGKEKQALDVFYDAKTKKVIGWISYGKEPVWKKAK